MANLDTVPGIDRLVTANLRALEAAFAERGHVLLVAGGAVRDLLAGRAPADVDLAVNAGLSAIRAAIAAAGGRAVASGTDHGTLTAVFAETRYEITQALAPAGRDPFAEDARRRDLTINALFATLDGWLIDHVGGADDLAAGRVRFTGHALSRIDADPLRILRFFRFAAGYGDPHAELDPAATTAIQVRAHRLAAVPGERIRKELSGFLTTPEAARLTPAMRAAGVTAALGLDGLDATAFDDAAGTVARFEHALAWAAPDDASLDPIARRLRLSRAETGRMRALRAARRSLAGMRIDKLRAAVGAGHDAGVLADLLRLTGRGAQVDALLTPAPPAFPITGDDLLAAGAEQGPSLGRLLAGLKNDWIAAGGTLDRAALVARARARVTPA